jgi:hypothetical protein
VGRAGGVFVEADGEGRARGSRFEVRGVRFVGGTVRASGVVRAGCGCRVEVGPEAEFDGAGLRRFGVGIAGELVLIGLPIAGLTSLPQFDLRLAVRFGVRFGARGVFAD